MSTVVVVNPASAAGRTGRDWPLVTAALRDAGVDVETRLTAAPGDATALTREALAAGVQRVVACGGDGTFNEVVNGYLDGSGVPVSPDACIGLIPSGTGGDLRRTLGLPVHVASAAALLARGDVRRVDAGRIEYDDGGRRHFVNVASCGLGGEVDARVNASRKAAGGRLTFLWHSLRALAAFGRQPARIEVDGALFVGDIQNVAIANGRYFGGGMRIAPGADPADGLLDVVVIGAGRLRSIVELPRVYSGSHLGRPGVVSMRGTAIRVTPLDDRRLLFDVDGEQVGHAPATVRVLPGVLRVCAPARS